MDNYVMTIYIQDPKDVRDICNIINTYDVDVDARKGRYTIDAKSIVGLLMFLGTYVEICLPIFREDIANKLREDLAKWRINHDKG